MRLSDHLSSSGILEWEVGYRGIRHCVSPIVWQQREWENVRFKSQHHHEPSWTVDVSLVQFPEWCTKFYKQNFKTFQNGTHRLGDNLYLFQWRVCLWSRWAITKTLNCVWMKEIVRGLLLPQRWMKPAGKALYRIYSYTESLSSVHLDCLQH